MYTSDIPKNILDSESGYCAISQQNTKLVFHVSFKWCHMSVNAYQITGNSIVCPNSGSNNEALKLHITVRFGGKSTGRGEIASQRGNNVESVSISWRHYVRVYWLGRYHSMITFQMIYMEDVLKKLWTCAPQYTEWTLIIAEYSLVKTCSEKRICVYIWTEIQT